MIAACLLSLSLISAPVGTWVPNLSQIGPLQLVRVDPGHAGRLYAGDSIHSRIFESNDSGASWTLLPGIPGSPPGIQSMAVSPGGVLFITDEYSEVDVWNGSIWKTVSVNQPIQRVSSTPLGVFGSTNNYLYQLSDNGTVAVTYNLPTVNFGQNAPVAILHGQVAAMLPNYGLVSFSSPTVYSSNTAVTPANDLSFLVDPATQTAYVESNAPNALYEMRSGDTQFTELAPATVVANQYGNARLGADGTVYVQADAYVADGGKNDIVKLTGTFDAPTYAVVGSASEIDSTHFRTINDFDVAADGTIYLATTAGIETIIGGVNSVLQGGPFIGPNGTILADARTYPEGLELIDLSATSFTSSDGFALLAKQAGTPILPDWTAQDPATHIGFTQDTLGNLYRSSAGAWVADDSTGYQTSVGEVIDGSSNAYAFGSYGILKSHRNADGSCAADAGTCWSLAYDATAAGNAVVGAMAVDGSNLYAGALVNLLVSSDSGATWTRVAQPLDNQITSLVVDPQSHRPWLATASGTYELNSSNTIWQARLTTSGQPVFTSKLFVDTGTSPTTIWSDDASQTLTGMRDGFADTVIIAPASIDNGNGVGSELYFNAVTRVFYAGLDNTAYAYALPSNPTIIAISAATGPTSGGTAVKITGTNFIAGTTEVFFGTQNAPGTVVSSTEIDVTSPANQAGAVDITVANFSGQQASLTSAFTYTGPSAPAAGAAATAPVADTTSTLRSSSGCSATSSGNWGVPALLGLFVWSQRRRFSKIVHSRASSHASNSSKGNAMKLKGLLVGALLALAACHGKGYYFTGRVYDGVTRQPITNYKIQLQYNQSTVNGTVNKDGTYFVGPLPALVDYSVAIDATGYRTFLSVNEKLNEEGTCNGQLDDCTSQDETEYYDAYVFPTALQSPAQTITVVESDSATAPASGTVRFVPDIDVGEPASELENNEQAPENQWANDADAQFGTVTATMTNGVVQLAAGALVYGANYQVTVYGVPGYGISTNNNFVAGVDGDVTLSLNPLQSTDNLEIIYISTQNPTPAGSATLTIVFNEPISLAPTYAKSYYVDQVNDASTFTSADANADGTVNTPVVPAGNSTLNEFGIDIEVTGNALTITASLPASAYATKDAGTPPDPIDTFTFGHLNDIYVVSTANPNSSAALTSIDDEAQVNLNNSMTVTVNAATIP